jgi:hypothetical protein
MKELNRDPSDFVPSDTDGGKKEYDGWIDVNVEDLQAGFAEGNRLKEIALDVLSGKLNEKSFLRVFYEAYAWYCEEKYLEHYHAEEFQETEKCDEEE